MESIDALKYPIGKYDPPLEIPSTFIEEWITNLADFPAELTSLSLQMSEANLETPYRPDGWTGRQVIHHLADSHINAYTRFHLTLTEEKPIIRPYFEDRWAELADGKQGDIQLSVEILKAIHTRLVFLLRSLEIDQFDRTYIHPETKQEYTMAYLLGNYAWHGKHHLAHLKLIMK
jgi:hypothetical protein